MTADLRTALLRAYIGRLADERWNVPLREYGRSTDRPKPYLRPAAPRVDVTGRPPLVYLRG